MTNESLFEGPTLKAWQPVIVSDGPYDPDKIAIIIPTQDITSSQMGDIIAQATDSSGYLTEFQ